MSSLDLKLDETNKLVLNVDITGSDPIDVVPKVRFVCESDGVSYVFHGRYNSSGEVEIDVPIMEGKLKEGTYSSTLEVILENKIFFPLKVDLEFSKSTQVMAEIVVKKEKKSVLAEKISAQIISKPKAKPKAKPGPKNHSPKRTLRAKFGK